MTINDKQFMKTLGSVMSDFKLDNSDKYLSREFQRFGIHLAESLGDSGHKSLYIKLAKDYPRTILDEALSFVVDSSARSKPKLFMWKLKQLRDKANKT